MKQAHRECKKPCKVPPGSKNCVSLKGLKISSLKTDEYLFYPIESHLSNSWLLSLPSLLSYSFDSQIKGENCFFSILLLSPNCSFPKLMALLRKDAFNLPQSLTDSVVLLAFCIVSLHSRLKPRSHLIPQPAPKSPPHYLSQLLSDFSILSIAQHHAKALWLLKEEKKKPVFWLDSLKS